RADLVSVSRIPHVGPVNFRYRFDDPTILSVPLHRLFGVCRNRGQRTAERVEPEPSHLAPLRYWWTSAGPTDAVANEPSLVKRKECAPLILSNRPRRRATVRQC